MSEKLLPKSQRHDWLLIEICEEGYGWSVDVVNRDFVRAYCDATNAPHDVMPYGADKCAMLGRDMSEMHTKGLLTRGRTGIEGMGGMGFPRWVFSYRPSALGVIEVELAKLRREEHAANT